MRTLALVAGAATMGATGVGSCSGSFTMGRTGPAHPVVLDPEGT